MYTCTSDITYVWTSKCMDKWFYITSKHRWVKSFYCRWLCHLEQRERERDRDKLDKPRTWIYLTAIKRLLQKPKDKAPNVAMTTGWWLLRLECHVISKTPWVSWKTSSVGICCHDNARRRHHSAEAELLTNVEYFIYFFYLTSTISLLVVVVQQVFQYIFINFTQRIHNLFIISSFYCSYNCFLFCSWQMTNKRSVQMCYSTFLGLYKGFYIRDAELSLRYKVCI